MRSKLPLNAKPGDILFSRDVLRSEGGTVTFLACSGNTEQTLSPDGDVVFDARGPKLRAGRVTGQKPAAGCFLPPVPRFVIASQQHADAAIAEELSSAAGPQTFDERLHELPEERRTQATAELAALNKAANPNDAVNHLARALVFEKYSSMPTPPWRCGRWSAPGRTPGGHGVGCSSSCREPRGAGE